MRNYSADFELVDKIIVSCIHERRRAILLLGREALGVSDSSSALKNGPCGKRERAQWFDEPRF